MNHSLLVRPPHTATLLHIVLFGPPQLAWDEQSVALPRRQLRALLYRLAATLQPVSRDQLCFLFWPDISETAARRNLTVLLNQLRNLLPSPDLIVSQRDVVALDRARVHVDVATLAAALLPQRRHDLDALSAAVALYRGPFLDGFALPGSAEFDTWAERERHAWERRYLDALALLIDGYAERGAYAEAIEAVQWALAVDALAEEMHRRLIVLYAELGDRTAALRQFEQCAVVLERELGVSPLPETRAVYEAVRDGRLPRRSGIERAAAPARFVAASSGALAVDDQAQTSRLRNIPAAPTPLIGRAEECARAIELLRAPGVRLVTLCGPGGSGKTRLALQLAWEMAERFADGAVFVALAALHDGAPITHTIAHACGLKQGSSQGLSEYLRDKELLLVLDNCEHLPDLQAEVARLLAAAPGLRVLTTSRAALNLQAEHLFSVPPLPLPDLNALPSLAALAEVPSVALLLARTEALNPRFQLTAENASELAAICVRLDGLPLAIELAAARLKLLAPRDLLRRLDRRLALLTSGARDLPDRHQTLRATIDWSYRLLDTVEQRVFESLAVFSGGWSLAAVEALWPAIGTSAAFGPVSALDSLAVLVDQSLVQHSMAADGTPRFTMLETIREYAAEQLHQRGSAEAMFQAHADYFVDWADQLNYNAPDWLATIERDLDNLRAALRWLLEQTNGADAATLLGSVLARFWYWRDWVTEGRWWLEQIVACSAEVRTETRARILCWAGMFANLHGDPARAIELYEASLRLSQELQFLRPWSNALVALATIHGRRGDYPRATAYLEEALDVARELDNPDALSNATYMLAGILVDQGRDIPRALALYEECLTIARTHGLPMVESMTLSALGIAYALTQHNPARAAELLPLALRLQRESNATMAIGWTLQYLGMLAYLQGDYPGAAQHFSESLSETRQGGAQYIVPSSLEGIAGVMSMLGQPEQAARLLGAVEAMREDLDFHRAPIEHPLYDAILSGVRAQLPAAALWAAWQQGRTLTAAQAIAEAETFARDGLLQPDL